MPCDTKSLPGQTLTERKTEIREAVTNLSKALATGKVKVVIGPQGAIAFQGWSDTERARVTDACAFRRVMVEGSALAKAAITRAEQLAGRTVNKQAVAAGYHAHSDGHGGLTWHHGH